MPRIWGRCILLRQRPRSLAATAQSLYGALSSGVVMGVMTLAAGPLYQAFGGQAYLLSAAAGALGLLGALYVAARWDGSTLIDETEEEDDHRDHTEPTRPGC